MAEQITLDVNDLPHVRIINEENVDIKTLPLEIRKNIVFINGQIKKFAKNPTQKFKAGITKYSIKIADSIQDHLEKDFSDETNPNNNMKEGNNTPPAGANDDSAAAAAAAEAASASASAAAAQKPNPPKKELIKGDSSKANKIYSELEELLKQNKTTVSLEELKNFAPASYAVIFDSYKDDEENGIEIGDIQLKETEKEKFIITK